MSVQSNTVCISSLEMRNFGMLINCFVKCAPQTIQWTKGKYERYLDASQKVKLMFSRTVGTASVDC